MAKLDSYDFSPQVIQTGHVTPTPVLPGMFRFSRLVVFERHGAKGKGAKASTGGRWREKMFGAYACVTIVRPNRKPIAERQDV